MEEKKLTNEEIIKDIERSTGMPSYWKNIVLDLIYRLQNDITEKDIELERARNAINERDEWYSEQKAENERLQSENERLTEEKEDIRLFQLAMQNGEIDMLLESPMAKCFYDCIVQIFEQNGAKNFFTTTVELNGQKGRYAFTIEKTGGVTPAERIAELQKQVDELKQENSVLSVTIELQEEIEKQALKDATKEIYDYAKYFFEWDEEGFVASLKYALEERYGVEVE